METHRRVIFNICSSADSYGAYSSECEGVWGAGTSVPAVKEDVYRSIQLIKENLPFEEWPETLKGEYIIEWHYDVQALLNHFQGTFSHAALERLTGINQKQLWNYANGASRPREKARKKIETALHALGRELMGVNL